MMLQTLFWMLMIIWLLFGFWNEYVPGQPYPVAKGGRHLLMFVLFAILGWEVFGAPIK